MQQAATAAELGKVRGGRISCRANGLLLLSVWGVSDVESAAGCWRPGLELSRLAIPGLRTGFAAGSATMELEVCPLPDLRHERPAISPGLCWHPGTPLILRRDSFEAAVRLRRVRMLPPMCLPACRYCPFLPFRALCSPLPNPMPALAVKVS